jgi:uncharacterized protein YbaR (Trm112 family)
MSAASASQASGAARAEGLLQILVCPACRSRLVADVPASELICTNPECALAYRVTDDGVPVLLIDEARPTKASPEPAQTAGPDAAAPTT